MNAAAAPIQAKRAGLTYVYDSDPGYTRRKRGKGFVYLDNDGNTIKDRKIIARLNKLAIPPAYEDVWICQAGNGHLQFTGRDERGRKQYRYHEKWREMRDKNKFGNMLVFGQNLPKIRRHVLEALNLDGLPKEKVIAAVVRLLDCTGLRVGNDAYSDENHTYGLTTIRKKHFDLHGKEIELDFPGKGGKVWRGTITDEKAAAVLAACDDLPGYRLFKYLGDDGERNDLHSGLVNEWLQAVTDEDITAKDFRTWHACVSFLEEAIAATCCAEGKTLKLKPVLKSVAEQLGNTPAILQKSYIHPDLIDLYRTGCFLQKEWQPDVLEHIPNGLKKHEGLMLNWLEKTYG